MRLHSDVKTTALPQSRDAGETEAHRGGSWATDATRREVVRTRRLEVALGTRLHGDVLPVVGEVVGARRWRRRRLGLAGGRA
jgi:hypothetical protein